MKFFRLLSMPLMATVLLCFTSCGDHDDKSSDNDVNTDSANTTTTADEKTDSNAKVNTIITTPQEMMVMRHKVSDFNKWLAAYDAHDSLRLANGIHSYVVSRGLKDSNMVQVTVKVDDLNKAKAFAKDPSLKKAMKESGVTSTPLVNFTTITYQDTGSVNSDLRSRTSFTVKDWDKWSRGFDSTRQMRLDNGLVDRAYGHDADNNHKVTVVVAILDTAKAFAFWKSDQLKKAQAAGGVTSTPERFLYRVAKRY